MKKKIFSLMLCLVMVICLLPITAYAAANVDSADIMITHPAHLENPETFLQVYGNCQVDTTYNSKGHKNGLRWKDLSTGEYMDENDTFVGGQKYELSVYLLSKTGYSFSVSTPPSITVNGDAATLSVKDVSHATATITLTADNLYINHVTISGLDAPKADNAADFSVSLQETTCNIYSTDASSGMFWLDRVQQVYLTKGDKFQAGHQYTFGIYIKAKSGYEFPKNVQATINGKACTIGQNNGNMLQVKMEYPALATSTPTNTDTPSNSTPKITTKSLPNATKGKDYYVKLECTDADAVFSEIMGSQLSEFGLVLTQHGEIEGKPTKAGNCHVNIRTVSENGNEDSTSFDITIKDGATTSTENDQTTSTSAPTQSTDSTPTDSTDSTSQTDSVPPTDSTEPNADDDASNETINNDDETKQEKSYAWIWIVIAAVVVLGAGSVVTIIFIKKNNSAK